MIDYRQKMNPAILEIAPSGIRKFFDIANEMKDVISLSIGEPDFVTPWHVRQEGIRSLEDGKTWYSPNRGFAELREEICRWLQRHYHVEYHPDKEVLVTIQKAVDASPELRSKKQLIESFIAQVNELDDVMAGWHRFVAGEREKELQQLIQEEKLRKPGTRKFLENAFRDGEIKTTGTDIDKLMPPVSRFGGGGARAKKKQNVIEKLQKFFEKFFGLGNS